MKRVGIFLIVFGFVLVFAPLGVMWLGGNDLYTAYIMVTGPAGICFVALGLLLSHRKENDNKLYLQPKNKILGTHINPGVAIILFIVLAPVIGMIIEWFR